MTRRAYLRLDPDFFERKVIEDQYPPGAAVALISTFCLAEDQPQRGRFRSEKLLRVLLDGPDEPTKLARWVPYLIEHGDLIAQDRGVLYVDGWDEWQEGDWKVAERVRRIRSRKDDTPDVTPDVTVDVTPDVTVPVTVNLQDGRRQAAAEAYSGRATTTVENTKPRERSPSSNEPRLTQHQLDSWNNFGSRWDAFKEAWLRRGLMYAPFGSPDDDDTSQRGLLFQVLDNRPTEIVRWVKEAPVPTSREIITYVLDRWHKVRADAGLDDEAWEAEKVDDRRKSVDSMSRISDLVNR